jgi:hypothetical protein
MNGYNLANEILNKHTRRGAKNTSFGNWLQQHLTRNSDLCRGLASLPAFLISPVQRLPRYLLFLKDLFTCTPKDHPDFQNVQEAYDIITESVLIFFFQILFTNKLINFYLES